MSSYITQQYYSSPILFWKDKSKDDSFISDLKKDVRLKDLIRYDENFNNKRKVEFESALSGIIRSKPRKLKYIVNHVAQSIWPDINDAFFKAQSKEFWICQHMLDVFYANDDIRSVFLADSKNYESNQKDNFFNWMNAIIHSTQDEDAYKQLLLIREYGYFFLRPFQHMPKFKALNNGQGINIIPDGIGNPENKVKMRILWKKYRGDNWPSGNSIQRSRIEISKAKSKKTCSFGIIHSASKIDKSLKKFIPDVHLHLPGTNVWRVTNTSFFTQNARYDLDMPLIASQSDSISLLLIPAIVIGKLSNEDLKLYNLSVISYMVGNGHHSIHEFKPVWQAFDISYNDGDYASIFPSGLIQDHPELLELRKHFPDLLGNGIEFAQK